MREFCSGAYTTELAIRDPAHIGIAQLLLGHADYRTTQQAYNLARALDAAGRHHAVVQSIRSRSGALPRTIKRAEIQKQSTERARSAIRMSRRPSCRDAP